MAHAPLLDLEVKIRLGPVAVDFAARGPVLGLFGPSGSGKTTTLEAIAGLRRPDSGRIALGGRVLFDAESGIDLPAAARRVGLVPQDGLLFPHLDVRANLTFGAPRAGGRLGLDEVAALLEVAPLLSRRPASLSGGERQRVALGRALLREPSLLLLDEPLASLDDALRGRLLALLGRVRGLGFPMIYVSHRPSEVRALADEVVMLRAGRLAGLGAPSDVLAPASLAAVDPDAEAVALLEGTVVRRDGEVAIVAIAGADFEVAVAAPAPEGTVVRLEVPAAAVTLFAPAPRGADPGGAAAPAPGPLSARNRIPARVTSLCEAGGAVLVEVRARSARLFATVTHRAVDELGLAPGRDVVAAVKATAIRAVGC